MSECDKWVWRLCRYDDRVHAFARPERPAGVVEAACGHSVPCDQTIGGHPGARCISCLLIVGDHIAEYHRLGVGC